MLMRYARISKGEAQTKALQVQALKQAGVEKIFSEPASGGRWDRPVLHTMLDQLRYTWVTQATIRQMEQ